jgi:hypothetical protein
LIELAVEPKYYFEDDHPDWKESDDFTNLSEIEFSTLRTQLERIWPIGKLVKPANTILVVTNMTGWETEYYANASLTWGVVTDLRKGENPHMKYDGFDLSMERTLRYPTKQNKDLKLNFPQ